MTMPTRGTASGGAQCDPVGLAAGAGRKACGRRLTAAGLLLFALAGLVRVGLVGRSGLWADETFSLAMVTGHSLERPPSQADPALGDYVEFAGPAAPSAYRRYLEYESPPAGPGRVLRAVLLSDTSPPLYYLLLYGWTRALGTGDAALRLFSVGWALACFPVLWSLARQVGGRAAALPTCLLFSLSPVCVFYSIEGRMYSLVWFWAVSTLWLTLRLARRGFRPGAFLLWVAVGAAGLLTHYFFAFVWAGALAWLWFDGARLPRRWLVAGAALVGLLVLPWYVRLPESLAGWRVTGDWLTMRPGDYHFVLALGRLLTSFFSINGTWGVPLWWDALNLAVYLVLAVVVWKKFSWSLFTPRRRLLWLWLAAACLGLIAFDLLRGTYTLAKPRYALAALPAAYLLAGLGLGRLGPRPRAAFLALIVLACLVGDVAQYRSGSRHWEPFRQLGRLLDERAGPSDLVIVHSIPSGVAAVARYLETDEVGFASWVGQLKQRRTPEDLQRLAAGRRKIFLVKIHEVGEPAPEEDWLRENATLADEYRLESATVLTFVPRGADTFFAPGP